MVSIVSSIDDVAYYLPRFCWWCQSLDLESCIFCLGHLHTFPYIALFGKGVHWPCHKKSSEIRCHHWPLGRFHPSPHPPPMHPSWFPTLGCALNHAYIICDPLLFRQCLHVKILCHQFDTITFIHIPRIANAYVDYLANEVLDWYLSHA